MAVDNRRLRAKAAAELLGLIREAAQAARSMHPSDAAEICKPLAEAWSFLSFAEEPECPCKPSPESERSVDMVVRVDEPSARAAVMNVLSDLGVDWLNRP